MGVGRIFPGEAKIGKIWFFYPLETVVVISDSNMSQSASSEDSISVNVNSGITTNETVWMKEGDTTEDENSITINAEWKHLLTPDLLIWFVKCELLWEFCLCENHAYQECVGTKPHWLKE